jgi:hypothetical protein
MQVSLKSEKSSGHFTCKPKYMYDIYIAEFFLE